MRRNWPYLHSEHIYSLPTIREILNRFRNRFRKDKPPDPITYIFEAPTIDLTTFRPDGFILYDDTGTVEDDESAWFAIRMDEDDDADAD